MVHQQRSVTIMTGISGVAASHLAHTLATRLVGEWSVVSLEDFLAEADRNIRGDESKQYIVEILNQPEPALESLWLEAFRLAKTAVGRALSNSSVLFTLHATWLSPESTSITAGSDPQSLGQVDWNVSKVINFIDDVYDCYERLSGQGGILRRQKGKTLDKEVLDLLLLLEWREAEFRQSQQIARALSVNGTTVPTYMVAVKHPLATIVRLVESADPNTVYLSHPITLLRTAQGGIGSHPLIDEIQTTAAILRRSEIVLFEPTAIDERRFNFDTADEPLLSERWPAFVDINGDEESALFERDRDQPFKRLLLANERFGKDIPGAVKILEDRIDRQINWRDRQLVIQSNSLVVLRPFARDSGVVSGGVRVEAELHAGLARVVGQQRYRGVVFHPAEDERKRLFGAILSVLIERLLDEDDQQLSSETLAELVREDLLEFINSSVESIRPDDHTGLRSLAISVFDRLEAAGISAALPNKYASQENLGIAEATAYGEDQLRAFSLDLAAAVRGFPDAFTEPYRRYSFRPFAAFFEVLDRSHLDRRQAGSVIAEQLRLISSD